MKDRYLIVWTGLFSDLVYVIKRAKTNQTLFMVHDLEIVWKGPEHFIVKLPNEIPQGSL